MFGLVDHIKMMNASGRPYMDGFDSFKMGASITDCPQHGTTWDQANWIAGWLDSLAEKIRNLPIA